MGSFLFEFFFFFFSLVASRVLIEWKSGCDDDLFDMVFRENIALVIRDRKLVMCCTIEVM